MAHQLVGTVLSVVRLEDPVRKGRVELRRIEELPIERVRRPVEPERVHLLVVDPVHEEQRNRDERRKERRTQDRRERRHDERRNDDTSPEACDELQRSDEL